MKTTKKIVGIAAVFAMFIFGSCEKLSPIIVPFTSKSEFLLVPATGKNTRSETSKLIHSWDFNQSIETIITEYGGDPEQIKESNIVSVTLTFAEGEQDIELSSIFNSLQLKMDKIPSTEEELVAESAVVGANSISFELVKKDIFDYTSSNSGFTFLLYGDVNYENFFSAINLIVTVESQLAVSVL